MANTISSPNIALTCLLVFIGALYSSLSRLGRGLVARFVRYGPAGIARAAGAFILATGVYHDALVGLDLDDGEDVQRARRWAGDDDAALLGVCGAVAGAAEPALARLELEVRAPGDGAAQVRALAPEGQQAAGRLLPIGRGARLQVQQKEAPLRYHHR